MIGMNRHRKRRASLAILALALSAPGAVALQSLDSSRRTTKPSRSVRTTTVPTEATLDVAKRFYNFDQLYNSAGEEEEDDELFVEAFSSFQQLVRSTGSEILPSDIQKLIDQGPEEFLEKHGESALEKIAMISITEQLPQKAVQALRSARSKTQQRTKMNNNVLFAKNKRVTPEEEIALARIIKAGAALYKIRTDALEAGRELSHKEWADLAGMTAKELRRQGTLSNSHVPECELVRVPQREKNKWNKILRAQKDILAKSNTPKEQMSSSDICVPLEEISAETGLTVAEILSTQRRMKQAQRVLSLDYKLKGQSRSGVDNGPDESLESRYSIDDKDLAERTQMRADILAAMARNLDAREGRLMRLRYGLTDGRARTLHECADAMGLSYTRVNQLAKQCLAKLRQAAEAESLEEYLLTIA